MKEKEVVRFPFFAIRFLLRPVHRSLRIEKTFTDFSPQFTGKKQILPA